MTATDWPPEFDGIKLEDEKVLARVKNTDVWLELDTEDPSWQYYVANDQRLASLFLAWQENRK